MVIVGSSRFNAELLHYFSTHYWGFEVVAVELTGIDGVAAAARTKPEFVLASLGLADLCASEVINQLRRAAPAAKIIGIISQCNEYLMHTLGAVEYHGLFFDADESLCSLAQAIERVRQGIRFVSPRIAQCQAALRTTPTAFPKLLSKREQEVLVCIAHSMSNDEIGVQLGFSGTTAISHRKKIMGKLNIHSTPQLIRYCIEKGFNSAHPPHREAATPIP